MKTKCEHRCTHIYRTASSILLLVFVMVSGLYSATWNIEESPAVFSYKWEISHDDLTEFVKSGQISNSGISGSFYYQGRYYPIYTTIIQNTTDQLAFQIKNREESILPATEIVVDYGNIDPKAIDRFDIGTLTDYVRLQEIPGIGTLVEITPCIPQEDGSIRCLIKADIQLLSTSSKSLKRSNLEKPRNSMAKITSLKADLPDEFCALYIQEAGVYQVSGQDLADRDIDIRHIHPDNIKLFWWGKEIPCRVTSTYEQGQETFQYHDVVQFYIPKLKNPYGNYKFNPFSDYDVVQLNWSEGDGLRYIQENSEISDSQDKFMPDENRIFRSTVHIEKNQQYQPLARLHEEELSHKYEHEFYSPSIRVGRSVTFPFELWDPVQDSPYNVDFTLRMQGLTYSVDDEMDHQIYVTANNQYLLEDEWDGQVPKISSNADMQYNHENLIDGTNLIDISVRGFESNQYLDDQVLFDWLELSYDRYMIAHDNRLLFTPQHGPGRYLFQVKGLTSATNVLILKNETNWIRGYYVVPEDTVGGEATYSIYFEDQCNGNESYQVAGPGKVDVSSYGIVTIDSIRYVNRLENEYYMDSQEGDYIIITHKDFYEKALDLVAHKESMGFTPVIYEAERIYDEYNYGNESPYAIKTFLTEAYTTWHTSPEYVLLIGDTGTENPLPIIKYQSAGAIGAIITEPWFVDIDDDFVMEMALGRLPISTEDELDSIITKIIAFDLMESPKQSNRMALLTGPESTFRGQMQNYLNNVSPDYIQADRLYLYDSQVTGDFDAGIYATDTLVQFVNDGIFCMNYLGHGGGYTWDNYVLPYEAFDRFKAGKPFIVNSLTCFTNTFSNNNALGEMFIRHPRGGVSILSSTGYGWINSNYYIYEKLMQHMFEDHMSHGRATQFALTDYFFSTFGRNANFIDHVEGQTVYKYFRKSLFYQMCILGDPSARFPRNSQETVTVTPQSVSAGNEISIQVDQANIIAGQMDIVGSRGDERKFPLKQKVNLNFSQGSSQYTIPSLPDNIYDGLIQLTYWDDENNIYTSSTSIAFNAPFIENIQYLPRVPEIADSAVKIQIIFDTTLSPDSVSLRVYSDRSLNASYRILSMDVVESGSFETKQKLIYTSKTSFYTTESDTSSPISYFLGNYFMPVMYVNGEILTGDYYYLAPNVLEGQDISILDYSIEEGKSKLILYNQADTSVYVKVRLSINEPNIEYSIQDTVLTVFDVNGQYEQGTEKINTYYFDFLPVFGNSTLKIIIDPITINDSDTSNNKMEIVIENKWLKNQNGHFINADKDTTDLPGTTFKYILPGENGLSNEAVYINDYNRNYDLSKFGATQAVLNVIYINSSEENFDLKGSVLSSVIDDGKIICYLSAELDQFYVLPNVQIDSLYYFPIQKPGYYLLAYPNETSAPDIELNINAREILTGGFVSERSDFSVILKDNYGVNPLTYFWDILLDGEELPEENISFLAGEDIRELGINFKLDMGTGKHTLQVIAHDLVGNRAETEVYEIDYTGESELIDYGTFPNPFTNKTTFIYELTEQFDDVTIKIFTLSGQKIFTMSVSENAITDLPLYSIGYHEIPWYGKDEFGNTVANGVYFYIIEGIIDDNKVKSTGKIAKLR